MVEWKPIEDLGPYFGGLTGKTKDDFVDGNAKFITYMNVFTNPSLDVSTTGVVRINKGERQNRIQKGDILFTGSSETPEEAGMSCVVTDELNDDYYMNSFCFGIRLNQPEQYNLGYLKHILRSFNIRKEIAKSASGVTRFNISKARFGKIRIPIPSLSEQQRVVDILDTFTSSIENLKEQIAQRRKQYEYYRDQLLDLEGGKEVKKITLGELGPYFGGLTGKTKEDFIDGNAKFITYMNVFANPALDVSTTGVVKISDDEQQNKIQKGDILFTGSSETSEEAGMSCVVTEELDDDYYLNSFCFGIRLNHPEQFNLYFLKHILRSYNIRNKIAKAASGVTRFNISKARFSKVQIPIITPSEQQRIVSILDTFEASIANLEAQLAQREKQYEYYRNKLLTFE